MGLKDKIVRDIEEVGGRHDEASTYSSAPGDPGLCGGPGAISWEINGDFASVSLAGAGAIIMEVLHPSVMAGVYEQSTYRTQPLKRAQNTLGYVLRTTFGTTEAATKVIERVKKIHSYVNGTRPDGVEYRALDPELIAWVHTCIPWAIMQTFDRYRRPLSTAEKDQYLREQAVIGRMGGADWVPESYAELNDYVAAMAPKMEMTFQTREFIDFLMGKTGDENATSRRDQYQRKLGLQGSMYLMPEWARRMSGLYHSDTAQRLYFDPVTKLQSRLLRWAYAEPPCKQLAIDRCSQRQNAAV